MSVLDKLMLEYPKRFIDEFEAEYASRWDKLRSSWGKLIFIMEKEEDDDGDIFTCINEVLCELNKRIVKSN